MRLDCELGLMNGRIALVPSHLIYVENVHDRIDEIVEFIASSDKIDSVGINAAPIGRNLGHRISLAITSNPHIKAVIISPNTRFAMRDMLPWIAARGTLEHMSSLQKVGINQNALSRTSVQDWDLLFSLLLTSTPLQKLAIRFYPNSCDDAFMSGFSRYLFKATSLVSLHLSVDTTLSHPAVTCLYNCVAQSSLRKLCLDYCISDEANREVVAEILAMAIAKSSLELLEVPVRTTVLSRTTPVRSLDFAFSHLYDKVFYFKINRKWKPLLSANIPLGLWPQILHKAHASPETSHGPVGILFFLLREKPNLVPSNVH